VCPDQQNTILSTVWDGPEAVRYPGINAIGAIGGGEDSIFESIFECDAYFALQHLEGFGLGEMEVERWGLWRLVEFLH
jgi:hypothetical protein